jgi:hypothetical protein
MPVPVPTTHASRLTLHASRLTLHASRLTFLPHKYNHMFLSCQRFFNFVNLFEKKELTKIAEMFLIQKEIILNKINIYGKRRH